MENSLDQADIFVNGAWVTTKDRFQSLNPHDESPIADVANASPDDINLAVEAATKAFTAWSTAPYAQRAQVLLKAADIWEQRSADYIKLQQRECGATLAKAHYEASNVPEIFRTAAGMCYAPTGEVLPSKLGKHSYAERFPLGPIAVVSPWNFSGILTARGFAFALAAGNTVVLKPSEETPLTGGVFFAQVLAQAGLPAGVFNLVTCDRNRVALLGDQLVDDPRIKGVSFTGSTAVGRHIATKCAQQLKKCCLELGGKDNLIVRSDADLIKALDAASFGAFFHQGQICMSVERILVHQDLYDSFLSAFTARVAKISYGDPTLPSNAMGPMINRRQAARIEDQINDAVSKGAKIAVGGEVNGSYIAPTVLTNVTPDMSIYAEETFGPVVPVLPFSSDAEAIEIANDTPYGLSAGIISRDEGAALAMAAQLQTGMCHINDSSVNDEPHVPFGGVKESGIGRHGGHWSMETFSETRWITCERGGRRFPPGF